MSTNQDHAERWIMASLDEQLTVDDAKQFAHLAVAYATLALADQQRAANLLWLARMGSGPISDAYVGEARKLIGPVTAGRP